MKIEDVILITKKGKEKIEKELNDLINLKRPEVIKEIQHARAQGDLRENSDFEAAKQRQAEIEDRIQYLSNKLSKIKIISDVNKSFGIGSEIEFKNLSTNEISKIQIVGTLESDPFSDIPKISYKTLFASVLIKNKDKLTPGKVIEIPLEHNSYKIEVINIKY